MSRVIFHSVSTTLKHIVPFSNHWYVVCIHSPLLSIASSWSSVSNDFPPLTFCEFIKGLIKNHSKSTASALRDGVAWMEINELSASSSSSAFLCSQLHLLVLDMSSPVQGPCYITLTNASLSRLLEKGDITIRKEMLPSVSRENLQNRKGGE